MTVRSDDMKKSVKIIGFILIAIVICSAAGWVIVYNKTAPLPEIDYVIQSDSEVLEEDFETEINGLKMMDNTWEDALPQTEVYNLIKNHFDSPLAEGKTVKKAIVIGYDGCRVDNFRLLDTAERSAINHLLDGGGHAVFTYAGGVNYPEKNVQDTSTAPGWCSMLTGVLSDVHKITKNNVPKEVEPKTLLISLVEDGTVDSSAFYVSWDGHFIRKKSTYINEKAYIEENKINSVFLDAGDDNGTRDNIISDLQKPDCSDFIFSTLEYTDHAGHSTGFTLNNADYKNAFRNAEMTGLDIIEAIESRATYDSEDWLILITTDHGGIKTKHGGRSFEERITFIVSNKEIK